MNFSCERLRREQDEQRLLVAWEEVIGVDFVIFALDASWRLPEKLS